MGRIRTFKPDFSFDVELSRLSEQVRLFYLLSWAHMDKAGRAEDNPEKLRALIYPYHPKIDANKLLDQLHPKFVLRYQVDDICYLQVMNWNKHQRPHHTEPSSTIPAPKDGETTVRQRLSDGEEPEGKEGKGRERKGMDKCADAQFAKPDLEQITAYCQERRNRVDPERFLDHYIANGWRVGKVPMRDWKAAVRTWEKNAQDQPRPASKPAVDPVWKDVGL